MNLCMKRGGLKTDELAGVHFSLAPKGFVNAAVMIEYMADVVAYMRESNCKHIALIMDCWRAHYKDDIRALYAKNNIQIILVPAGLTSKRQPLDVGVFGALKAMYKHQFYLYRYSAADYAVDEMTRPLSLHIYNQLITTRISQRTVQHAFDRAIRNDAIKQADEERAARARDKAKLEREREEQERQKREEEEEEEEVEEQCDSDQDDDDSDDEFDLLESDDERKPVGTRSRPVSMQEQNDAAIARAALSLEKSEKR